MCGCVCMCVEKLEPKGGTAEDEQQSPVLHLRQKDSVQAAFSLSREQTWNRDGSSWVCYKDGDP